MQSPVGGKGYITDNNTSGADTFTGNALILNGTPGVPQFFTVNSGASLTFQNSITDGSSASSITKDGLGTLTLAGANSYSGGTTIAAGTGGTIVVSNATGLGTGGAVVGTGTVLNINGVTISNPLTLNGSGILNSGSLTGTGTAGVSGNIILDNNTTIGVANGADTLTLSGTVSDFGAGHDLTKVGSGTLVLSGPNTYRGDTTLSAGTLTLGDNSALGVASPTTALKMADGTTLSFLNSGNFNIANNVQISGTASFTPPAGTTQTLSGVISDGGSAGTLNMTGAGTLALTNANTYSGGTTISNGVLAAGHQTGGTIDALGSGDVTLDGGTLRADVSGQLPNTLTFNGGKTSTLSAAAGQQLEINNSLTVNANAVAQFGSVTDTGTVLLSGAPSIDPTASVVVAGGTLKDGGGAALTGLTFSAASTTVNAGAVLDFNDSGNQAIHNLQGTGSVVTGTVGGTTLSLFADSGSSSNFGGVISGPGAVLTQTYAGGTGGTVILSGDNTYTGGTTVCDCTTLQLGNGGTTGSILGDVTLGGTLVFNRSNTYQFDGAISDDGPFAGKVVQAGTGTLYLTNNNSYSGGTAINAGTVMIGNNNALGSGDVTMAAGTTLSFDSNASYNIQNNFKLNGDPTFSVNTGDFNTISGLISDASPGPNAGVVEKIGGGTLALTNANTYSGGTIITAGTVQVSQGTSGGTSSVGTGAVTLNGGTFQSDGASNLSFNNAFHINGAGGTLDNNGRRLTLSGTISDGSFGAGGPGQLVIVDSTGTFNGITGPLWQQQLHWRHPGLQHAAPGP